MVLGDNRVDGPGKSDVLQDVAAGLDMGFYERIFLRCQTRGLVEQFGRNGYLPHIVHQRAEIEALQLTGIETELPSNTEREGGRAVLVASGVAVALSGDRTHRVHGLDQGVPSPAQRLLKL
jgi:hypothetical protein